MQILETLWQDVTQLKQEDSAMKLKLELSEANVSRFTFIMWLIFLHRKKMNG